MLINKPVNSIVLWLWKATFYLRTTEKAGKELGQIIGYESLNFYKIEVKGKSLKGLPNLKGELVYLENDKKGIVGVVVDEQYLVGRRWGHVFSLRNADNSFITFSLKSFEPLSNQKTIYSRTNAVKRIALDDLEDEVKEKVLSNTVYKNYKKFVGYVWKGSTIKQIKFLSLFDKSSLNELNIAEGAIVETTIGEEKVLYQIIDGKTDEESLEKENSHGFTIATAQKLGKYNSTKNELKTVKWLPEIYAPVFLLKPEDVDYDASKFIGKLPNTNYGFPIKEPDTLVTHNTAILGILGIGKSCLTFELIQKLIKSTDVKVCCIDLTNQYEKELPRYINPAEIQSGLSDEAKDEIKNFGGAQEPNNPQTWGNEAFYKSKLTDEIEAFHQSDQRVLILNPDWHSVKKAGSNFKITHNFDLTAAEKTRVISERVFLKAKELGETTEAKFLVVYEEAHSLIPEWNSVANDGDKSATNGTAKVILQGRKYGLGSMVITQRTANISKSILNQCNTVFALRVFDDTGKQFLENYIVSVRKLKNRGFGTVKQFFSGLAGMNRKGYI